MLRFFDRKIDFGVKIDRKSEVTNQCFNFLTENVKYVDVDNSMVSFL